jgi:hypothetical protein
VPVTSGSAQSLDVKIPYRHFSGTIQLREFDNVGNEGAPATLPVTVPVAAGDPYITTVGSPVALTTGGTQIFGGPQDDDKLSSFNLPFMFPFFGSNFFQVTISTNGNLYFSTPPTRSNGDADDVPSSTVALPAFKMISGLWDDLYLGSDQRSDAGVFITQNSNQVIFRWQGVPCNAGPSGACLFGGAPVNFEIELRRNGTIKSRYGSGNTALFPVVGMAGGEPEPYIIQPYTSENSQINLTNAGEVVYTPRAPAFPAVQFSQGSYNVNEANSTLSVQVTRSGDLLDASTVDYATSDTFGANPCSLRTSVASSRCDYLTTLGTLQFAPGETTKTISIPIINDVYVESAETFTISLSNPTGAALGAFSTANATIDDNEETNGTSNPIDVAGFFVREHYVDFFTREPDTSGLNFWTNEITQCGADAACTDLKRINVSAAFFLSIEFQQTGYLVHRVYKASYGDATGTSTFGGTHQLPVPIVRLNEFLFDTQRIGRGVIVGQTGWEQVLENNKQAFCAEFVQRTRFATAFASTLTPAQFVDALFAKAAVTPSGTERQAAIDEFGGAGTSADLAARGRALRRVAENGTLSQQEFNRAFVLMQFFGYLRRNPDDPQDTDYTGYDFWLGKLNQFGGNFVNAEMVKAFITSIEYRQRFGP